MPISESDLPGVGKKHEIDLEGEDGVLVIVTHNTGKREMFVKPEPNADAEKVCKLSDQLARTVGSILEGAYFQPIQSDTQSTTLGGGTMIEWFEVGEDAPVTGRNLEKILADESIGIAVVAVQRNEEVIPASKPETEIEAGDTIVAVGTLGELRSFEALTTNDGTDSDVPDER